MGAGGFTGVEAVGVSVGVMGESRLSLVGDPIFNKDGLSIEGNWERRGENKDPESSERLSGVF